MKNKIFIVAVIIMVFLSISCDNSSREEFDDDSLVDKFIIDLVLQGDRSKTLERKKAAEISLNLLGYTEQDVYLFESKKIFADVGLEKTGDYTGWINLAQVKGIVTGDGSGNYNPEGHVTFNEWITILIRILGYEEKEMAWFDDYEQIAKSINLIDSDYRGSEKITIQQTAELVIPAIEESDRIGIDKELPLPGIVHEIDISSDNSAILIKWNRLPYATSYSIYRATSRDGVYENIGNVVEDEYFDEEVRGLVMYWYKIKAINSAGEGEKSRPVEFMLRTIPDF